MRPILNYGLFGNSSKCDLAQKKNPTEEAQEKEEGKEEEREAV